MATAEVMDPETRKEIFLSEFEKVPYMTKVCTLVGVAKSNVEYWRKSDPQFAQRYREVRENYRGRMVDRADQVVDESLSTPSPNPWLAIRILEQFDPEWKRDQIGQLSQVNIETVILNPSGTLDHTTLSNTETGTTGGGVSSPEPGGNSGSDGTPDTGETE